MTFFRRGPTRFRAVMASDAFFRPGFVAKVSTERGVCLAFAGAIIADWRPSRESMGAVVRASALKAD